MELSKASTLEAYKDWAVKEMRLVMLNDEGIWKNELLPIYKSLNQMVNNEDVNFLMIQRRLYSAVRSAERAYKEQGYQMYLGADGTRDLVNLLYKEAFQDIKSGTNYLENY